MPAIKKDAAVARAMLRATENRGVSMKELFCLSVLAFCMISMQGARGGQTHPLTTGNRSEAHLTKAPAVPIEMDAVERETLNKSAYLISNRQFDQALAELKPLARRPAAKVFVDWIPVPETERPLYRQAVQQALEAWRPLPMVKFEVTDSEDAADILVLFEREVVRSVGAHANQTCSEARIDPNRSDRRVVVIRAAVMAPYTENVHSAASITHIVAQGLGVYLGLAEGQAPTELMGPDLHSSATVMRPTSAEIQRVSVIFQARERLMDLAQKRAAVSVAKPVITVERVEMDAGDVWRGTNAEYVFTLKNTGDAPLEIEAKPNCGCLVPRYERVIAPGSSGQVHAEMRTTAYRGRIVKRIDIKSNDPITPTVALNVSANVRSVLSVVPSENPIVRLPDTVPATQDLQVLVNAAAPVEVTRVLSSAPYATATVTRGEDTAAAHIYNVRLAFSPAAPAGRSVFTVAVFTNSPQEPQINITVIAEKGILVAPASAYMGAISASTILPVSQIVTVARRAGAFHILKVQTDDPRLQVVPQTVTEGSDYRLVLTYKGGWPMGQVRGMVSVLTDDPAQPRIEIPVSAFVQGVGSSSARLKTP